MTVRWPMIPIGQQLTSISVAELRKIADWLTPLNFMAIQKNTYAKHARGTGTWLLESQDFVEWLSGEQSTLSIVGIRKCAVL